MVDFSRTCYVQCCLSILAVAELSKVQTTKTTGMVLSCRTIGWFLQYGPEMVVNSTWSSNNTLVSASLCSFTAFICPCRTADYWTSPFSCSQLPELHHPPHYVRSIHFPNTNVKTLQQFGICLY